MSESTSDATSLERRRAERVPVSIAVEVQDSRGFSIHSSRDLSIGGIFFDRAIHHAVGTKVKLTFRLPGEDGAVRCDGEVVNVPNANDYGMGVRFVGLPAPEQQRLEAFMTMHKWVLALTVVASMSSTGCFRERASRDRGASGFFENTDTIHAPLESRCKKLGNGAANKRCEEAKYLAEVYVRKLASGDNVCLDGGFGDEPGAACRARASVQDVAPQGLLLELRNPKPDSKWFNKDANQIWFEEGAMVDLYLQDHGY